jgi:hypothetical protein
VEAGSKPKFNFTVEIPDEIASRRNASSEALKSLGL